MRSVRFFFQAHLYPFQTQMRMGAVINLVGLTGRNRHVIDWTLLWMVRWSVRNSYADFRDDSI
jgi:hypothetical protein